VKGLLFIVFISVGLFSRAQDIHFSQFYMNPVYLNPALTGNFDGDWRFTANQRSQWRAVSRPFNTLALSAENREGLLLPGLYHAVNIFHDAAGDGNYRTIEMNLSSSYQRFLDLDSTHSVTPGLQIGFNHKRIDFSQLNFDNQFNGFYYDPDLPTLESLSSTSRTGLNFSIGAIYTYQPEARKKITAGIAWFNLPQAKQSFYGNELIKRDKRVVIHAKALYELNFEWDLQPGIFMQFQGKYKELVFGSNVRYLYKDKKGEFIAPYAGLWFRNKDAVYLTAGAYYNEWTAGISYDVNVSQLAPASNVRGGLEFSLQYILHLFKPKEIQHRICPDYL
jgi:type IX secretion system PorP/SprF family membrane protein